MFNFNERFLVKLKKKKKIKESLTRLEVQRDLSHIILWWCNWNYNKVTETIIIEIMCRNNTNVNQSFSAFPLWSEIG